MADGRAKDLPLDWREAAQEGLGEGVSNRGKGVPVIKHKRRRFVRGAADIQCVTERHGSFEGIFPKLASRLETVWIREGLRLLGLAKRPVDGYHRIPRHWGQPLLDALSHRFDFDLVVRLRKEALIRWRVCTPDLSPLGPVPFGSHRCKRKPVFTAARRKRSASGSRVTGCDTNRREDPGSIRLFFASLLAASAAASYFRSMKRNAPLSGPFAALLAVAGLLCASLPARAQDAAVAAAEREEREANYKRMATKMEGIEETLHAQSKRIDKLISEISSLREEVDRLKNRNESAAVQENLRHLAEKIEEVDKKRVADGESVTRKLKEISKGVTKMAETPVLPAPPTKQKPEPPGRDDKAYTIKEGDTLVRIVTELRAQNYKITQKQVMDANPGVNWNRLKPGQTVIIPAPTP